MIRAELVSLQDVQDAQLRIRNAVRRTPLVSAPFPEVGGLPVEGSIDRIWLKCENLQRVSAFKARGAYHFVTRLTPEEREAGLLTYSSGNHAQAVAFAARQFKVPAKVVMPTDAPKVKRLATIALGADVEFEGTTSSERKRRAEKIQQEQGGTMVPPFDDPDARMVGVEPTGAASMLRSREGGGPVTLDSVSTVADGLKPVRPGDLTFAHCEDLVDEVVTVDDDSIRDAVRWLFNLGLVVEPSGAATVAALLQGVVEPGVEGETVAILSGGNIEPSLLVEWLQA